MLSYCNLVLFFNCRRKVELVCSSFIQVVYKKIMCCTILEHQDSYLCFDIDWHCDVITELSTASTNLTR